MVAAGFWLRNLFRMEYRVSALCSKLKLESSFKQRKARQNVPSTCDIYITGISISQKRFNSRLNRDDL